MLEPISLLPSNPHYFLFRGKPEILITSCEHYGAVINLDFDYIKYLDELKICGLNATRLFTGYYHEVPGVFGIAKNTLAPAADAYLCPWERTGIPGARDGGNKYDLDKFNEKYLNRLFDFCKASSDRGIVIELSLFCPFYSHALNGSMWEAAPFFHKNNINGVESVDILDIHNLSHPKLLYYQESLVKKIVTFLNGFDNIYYEICNEPYFDSITYEWQRHMAALIKDAEGSLKNKHLIGINVSNGYEVINNPDENFSVFSFHYTNSECMLANAGLKKVVGCNETGFAGSDATFYRRQAWELFMSGCGTYFGLDYSFAVGYEDGSFTAMNQPGTGGREFRFQLKALKEFLINADVFHMLPDNSFVRKCFLGNGRFYAMSNPGRAYAVYSYGASWFELDLPGGTYEVEWLNPITQKKLKANVVHSSGLMKLLPPEAIAGEGGGSGEIALSLTRKT